MKYNKIIIAAVALLIGTFSCTDNWNDHYDSNAINGGTRYDGTLWQAISSADNLNNFAKVLQATGYSDIINNTQVFTIFAPTDDMLTEAQAQQLIDSYHQEMRDSFANNPLKKARTKTVKEFILNHVALYNYSVSSVMNDTTLRMPNGKIISFTKNSFGNVDYKTSNLQTNNGVLYTLGNKVDYVNNIYEQLKADNDLDSVRNFIYNYTLEVLNPSASVPGSVIDGKQTYLDSVTTMRNEVLDMYRWLNALINVEDSTYWMVAPTNNQWKELIENKYMKYYKYDDEVSERDSLRYIYPRYNMLMGTIFSKSLNKNIFLTGSASASDSLMSTNSVEFSDRKNEFGAYSKTYNQFKDPFGANGILNGMVATECSNGKIFKGDKWTVEPDYTFLRDIIVEGENGMDSLNVESRTNPSSNNPDTEKPDYYDVVEMNPYYSQVSGHRYILIQPTMADGKFSKARFNIPNVFSNVPYDVYVVVAPAEADASLSRPVYEDDCKPIKLRIGIACNNEKGIPCYMTYDKAKQEATKISTRTLYVSKTTDKTKGIQVTNSSTRSDVESKAHVVDSVFVGTYTFPTCSYKTGEPQVKMVIENMPGDDYTSKLRLDAILFRPRKN